MEREILIDVSRLVWRFWRGGLPTGIDRVCLAYMEHFRAQAHAVVQKGGRYHVLNRKHSDALFDILSANPAGFRRKFVQLAARAMPAARARPAAPGMLYLNIGHTGLDDPLLPDWTRRSGVRAIYFIHDLIPLLHPEYCRPGEQAKHQRRMANVLKSAAGLIANSQATADDVASFAESQSVAMPPSVVAWIAGSPIPPEVTPATFDRPHFVVVGTIEGRKNHSLLLHIWKRFAARYGAETPLLLIVGQRGWEAGHALAMLERAIDLKGHVRELGKCGDAELANVIAGARALLMPSFAEGFGLPLSEALQLGTPVIASDLPVFREFAGDIPTYLDPLDGIGWENTITGFTGDSLERERQRQAMTSYRAPDWTAHFAVVDKWLESL